MNKRVKVAKRNVKRDRIRTQAVRWVAEKQEVTTSYVYAAINGTIKSVLADETKKAYEAKYNELKKILE